MEFRCNFDERDYTRMIAQSLKLQTLKMIVDMPLEDHEKVVILKRMLDVADEESEGCCDEME